MPLTAHEDCVLVVIDAQPGFYPEELTDRPAAPEALGPRRLAVSMSRPSGCPTPASR
jgi:hypothetical protein